MSREELLKAVRDAVPINIVAIDPNKRDKEP
jgi:hypothetical protein